MTHPTDTLVDQWTAGMLDGAAAASFEAHVDTCPACAARLTIAARRELALFAVAESARPARSRWPWLLAVALAASALLAARAWLGAEPGGEVDTVDVTVHCAALSDPTDCERHAAARGLMANPSTVPRYEAFTACITCGGGG